MERVSPISNSVKDRSQDILDIFRHEQAGVEELQDHIIAKSSAIKQKSSQIARLDGVIQLDEHELFEERVVSGKLFYYSTC